MLSCLDICLNALTLIKAMILLLYRIKALWDLRRQRMRDRLIQQRMEEAEARAV